MHIKPCCVCTLSAFGTWMVTRLRLLVLVKPSCVRRFRWFKTCIKFVDYEKRSSLLRLLVLRFKT
nr:hypothetical protein Q903MT_gene2829 [Picea sitchensis]